MSPKTKSQLAREHLDRALPAIDAGDNTEAVTWFFAPLEAAVVAVAERHGIDTKRQHWKKAEVSRQLYEEGHMPQDFSEILDILNDSRKVAVYEGEEPDLREHNLEDLAAAIETAVEFAEGGAGK